MARAYLTVDDSPSKTTKALVDALDERSIQAMFFCRGDYMEAMSEDIIYAIERGHIIGNHSYAHEHGGNISFDDWAEDLQKTEALIERAYDAAGARRPGKYYRFPYLDRGDGAPLERIWPEIITAISEGKAYELAENEEVKSRQIYLKAQGFSQPFTNLNHPIYKNVPAIAKAADTLLTYSTQDWLRYKRHQDRGVSLQELKAMLGKDPFISGNAGYEHVMLVHDHQEIYETSLALIDHMLETGLKFESLPA